MTGKPKLLWAGDAASFTGMSRVTHAFVDRWIQSWDVEIFGVNYFGTPHDYPYKIWPAKDGRDPHGMQVLPQVVDIVKPDLLVLFNDWWICSDWLDSLQNNGIQVPTVLYIPVDGEGLPAVLGKSLSRAQAIVTTTQFGKKQLESVGCKRVFVIGHGVDTKDFFPLDKPTLRDKYGIPKDALVIGNFNRNSSRKDIPTAINAYCQFAAQHPEAKALLYLHTEIKLINPDGYDLRAIYAATQAKYKLEAPLYTTKSLNGYHPELGSDALNEVYNLCDWGISATQAEGWGMTAFEHAATGGIQILPNHSVHPELWTDYAILVDPVSVNYTQEFAMRYPKMSADRLAWGLHYLWEMDPEARAHLKYRSMANADKWQWDDLAVHFNLILAEVLFPAPNPATYTIKQTTRIPLDYSPFDGGIFNPSMIEIGSGWLGIARAETEDYHSKKRLFSSSIPYLFVTDENLRLQEHQPIKFVAPYEPGSYRVDDFRLFYFQDALFCSHVFWRFGQGIQQGLSAVTPESIDFMGLIQTSFQPQEVEKNWGFFEWNGKLLALYGIQTSTPIIEVNPASLLATPLSLPNHQWARRLADAGLDPYCYTSVSCSPVYYDYQHLIFLFHQRDSIGTYRHWAALLNCDTLDWVATSKDPILLGGECEGYNPGFLLVGSVARVKDNLIIAVGEGDRYSGVIQFPVGRIQWLG